MWCKYLFLHCFHLLFVDFKTIICRDIFFVKNFLLTTRPFFDMLCLKGVKTLKERIKEIRKDAGLTQEKFAQKIGLKRNTIATYETGKSEPMDNIIFSICREFNINEEWLRHGTGPKHSIVNDDYTKITVDIDKHDPKARQAIMKYWELSEHDKELFWNFIEQFMKKGED